MNITIGITTCNRLKYSKAQKKSIDTITRIKGVETILVDNGSTEEGFESFLKDCEKDYDMVFRRNDRDWINDEYHAKNTIIENSSNDIILFLQDDLQFIGNKRILGTLIDDFRKTPIMCLDINGVRKITLHNTLTNQYVVTDNNNKLWITSNNHFQTMGLFKKSIFDKIGSYPVNWPKEKDYWGRSEDWYDSSVKREFPNIQITLKNHVPIFIPVWNDPRGGYAFIRGENRYGNYLDPDLSTGLYYDHLEDSEYNALMKNDSPSSFADVAKPIGWDYPKNEIGDQVKYPQSKVLEEGPKNDF